MAQPAIIQQAKATEANPGNVGATTITATFASALTSGSSLYCVFAYSNTATVTVTVSDPTNGSWTTLGQVVDSGDATIIGHAVFDGSTATTAVTVTVTFASAQTYRSCRIFEIGPTAGLDQHAEPTAQVSPGTGTDVITTGNMTPTSQPGLLVANCDNGSNIHTPAVGTGMSDDGTHFIWEFVVPFERAEHAGYSSLSAIAGTFTSSAGGGTDTYLTVGALFKPSGAAPAVTPSANTFFNGSL